MEPNKQSVLAQIEQLAKSNQITLDELKTAFQKGAPDKVVAKPHESRVTNLTNALYIAGGAIVVVALAFTIMQNWTTLDAFSRVLVTLGLGLALSVGGWLRLKRDPAQINKDVLGNTLLAIGSFACALGVFVAAEEAGFEIDSKFVTIMFGLMAGAFSLLYWFIMRSITWLVSAIFSATAAIYSAATWYLIDISHINYAEDFYNYLSTAVGISYLLLSRLFKTRAIASLLQGALYVFGNLFVLTPLLIIAFQDSVSRGEFGDLLFPIAVGAMILLSVYWHMSRAVFMPVFFLSIYIFHICYEYFADELGGSVALLIAGALVIGLSYATTVLSKRYLKPRT